MHPSGKLYLEVMEVVVDVVVEGVASVQRDGGEAAVGLDVRARDGELRGLSHAEPQPKETLRECDNNKKRLPRSMHSTRQHTTRQGVGGTRT